MIYSVGVIKEVGALITKEEDLDHETVAIIPIDLDQGHLSIEGIETARIEKIGRSPRNIDDHLVS